MVLAAMRLAHLPLEIGSVVLSGAGRGVSHPAVQVADALGLRRAGRALGGDPFLCWFDYFSLARSGMETSCFVFLAIASLEAIVYSRFVRAAACSALACLARPDGALLVALLMLALWRARRTVGRRARRLPALLLIIAGGWALYAMRDVRFVRASIGDRQGRHRRRPGAPMVQLAEPGAVFYKVMRRRNLRAHLSAADARDIRAVSVAAVALLLDVIRTRREMAARRTMGLLFFPTCYVATLALFHAFTFFP